MTVLTHLDKSDARSNGKRKSKKRNHQRHRKEDRRVEMHILTHVSETTLMPSYLLLPFICSVLLLFHEKHFI